jgi:hypothetical protein
MKIKIESCISYTNSIGGTLQTLKLDDCGSANTDLFKANQTIIPSNFSLNYCIKITLTKHTRISLKFTLICILDKTEKIGECTNLFSLFTHKYLAPVLKSIDTSAGKFIIHANRNYPVIYRKRSSNSFQVDFVIDAPYMHPSWDLSGGIKKSSAHEMQKTGTEYTCCFSIIELTSEDTFIPAMPLIYPNAHVSGFILTDHCDFDTAEKLKLFLFGNNNDGWLGKNLKITKGVFTLSSKSKDFTKNDSLAEEEYSKLIHKLYEDGSEIAPHALKSKGQLDAISFQEALQKISLCFHSQTWIDHGSYLKYCYSQGGKNNPEFMLIKSLKKFNYSSLWSFHDVNTDALNTLNIFTSKRHSSLLLWKKIVQCFVKGKWMIAMHYFRSLWHRNYRPNAIFDAVIYAMASTKGTLDGSQTKAKFFRGIAVFFKSFLQYKQQKRNKTLLYKNKYLLKYSDILFLEERRPLAQYKDGDLLMFSTFETTHLKDIYNKNALNRLISEYGLHIGHTYILNDLSYLNNIFNAQSGKKTLSKEWIDFMGALSQYVKNKEIWNPTMAEFVKHLTGVLNVEITYISGCRVKIENHRNAVVRDFTLLIPASCKKHIFLNGEVIRPSKKDSMFYFFVFDISARASWDISFINSFL